MKRFTLLLLLLCGSKALIAQPWMPSTANGPVKYAEALKSYGLYRATHGEAEEAKVTSGKDEQESVNSLFERWNYYWQQHLDKNGYMVPPVENLLEWMQYSAGQGSHRATTSPSNWVFQGPSSSSHGYSGVGRINTVAFDPVDSNTFYVGSAAGSTWKTTNGGASWVSLYDFLPTLGVADIKVNPRNRNTVYVATGDGDHGDAYSSGVIVSHDAGAHWSVTGLSWLPTAYNSARSLLINPVDTNSMILASNAGIFRTHNAGLTWTNVYSGDFKQILYNPTDTSIVYGSMYTSTSAQLMRSTNGGNSWTVVTSFTDAQRINLAVCPAAPLLVVAIASNNASGLKGIYRSTDNGATYSLTFGDDTACTRDLLNWDLGLPTTSCGGQGWYDLCIAINPTNANEITIGGVNTYFSPDGGLSWQICNTWYTGISGVSTVHADKHCLAYNSLTHALFETCDGGVYRTYDPIMLPWIDLTDGIGISQFYRNAVDNRVSFCIGGAQDNGTKMINAGTSTDLTGGDGMQPLINYGDPNNIWYCSYQNGSIDMTRDAGLSYHSITASLGSSGAWVTPYALHPTDTATLLLGYKEVFVSHDNGDTWLSLSPVFDTNTNIDRVVISAKNPNYIYASFYDYDTWKPRIHYTANFGVSWDTISIPFTDYISDIIIDPTNEKRFWVTISAYGVPKVRKYDLPTNTWTDETGSLPNLPVACMVTDTMFQTKYIGTDAAIYYKDPSMTDWALYNANLPTVRTSDLHINYPRNEIWAATFGRGMWRSRKADIGPSLLVADAIVTDRIKISPNPARSSFMIQVEGNTIKQGLVSVKLLNMEGKMIWHTNSADNNSGRILVNNLNVARGFYICEVSSGAGVLRTKLAVY